MRADIDDVRDLEITAYIPEIVSQMFDRGVPLQIPRDLMEQQLTGTLVPDLRQ
ncbi:hypothetical protein [Parasphingorhabdus sp.]|uniref:hypothetical protein n=1 Tax=Parasphingorhabdus sp. TaxID=2709688 RepID=UPI003A91BB0D